MHYDKGIEKITEWVSLNEAIEGDYGQLISVVPDGWQILTDIPVGYCLDAAVIIRKVAITKGLLRIIGEGSTKRIEDTFNILAQHVAVKSSLTCMVCGKRGYRKKLLEGWPSLCTTHHVQYVNYLDEQNNV